MPSGAKRGHFCPLALFVWSVVSIGWLIGCTGTNPTPATRSSAPRLSADATAEIAGTYCTSENDVIVIARSGARPTYYRPESGEVRVLFADSASSWRAGRGLLMRDSTEFMVEFRSADDSTVLDEVVIRREGSSPVRAQRVWLYDTQPVEIVNNDVRLAGTFFNPRGAGPHPGVVLVHGSGPQDRWGPFGYAYLVADHFARAGFAALVYDKRGVGGSSGNWRSAGFDELASDASAAMRWLASRGEVDASAVGLWGISQAGWVTAWATSTSPAPAFIVLVSAAGVGITVEEQNLYNITAELHARGFSELTMDRARDAWQRFYLLVERGGGGDPTIDSLVTSLREEAAVPADLLPPTSDQVDWGDSDVWFLALPLRFDPLLLWRAYPGWLLAVFGNLDAATPAARIVERVSPLVARGDGRVAIRVFDGANHFMLASRTGSIEELAGLQRFVPGVFETMTRWAAVAVGSMDTTRSPPCRRITNR